MSSRNEVVFQAIPFDASSSDANEPLIAAGDGEDEDHRLDEKAFSRFKFSSLLIGMLVGFAFSPLFILGVHIWVITVGGEDVDTKSKTDIIVLGLLCSCFYAAFSICYFGIPPQLSSDNLLGYWGTLQGAARRDSRENGIPFYRGCSCWHQSSTLDPFEHADTNGVFFCGSTGGRLILLQNQNDVLCHKYQEFIVLPIDGGTNCDGCLTCTAYTGAALRRSK
jgi:hypothetical protein